MNLEDLYKQVDSQPIKSIYWIYGAEKKLVDDLTDHLSKQLSYQEKLILFGSEVDLTQFISSLFEVDLFTTSKLIIFRECQKLPWTSETETVFLRWLDHPLSEYKIIFNGSDNKDFPSSIGKKIRDAGTVVEIKTLYEKDIIVYISEMAKKNNIILKTDAINLLVDLCGTDLNEIHSQWEKLLLYINGGKEIAIGDIQNVVGLTAHYNIFQLIDSLMEGQYKKSIKIVQSILDAGTHPLQSLAMLIRHFNQLERMYYYTDSSLSEDEIKADLQIRDFQYKKLRKLSKNLTIEKIQTIISILAEIDKELKTRASSTHHSNIIFEKGVLKIFHTLKK